MRRKRNKRHIPGGTDSISTGITAKTRLFSMVRRWKSKTLETLESIWFKPLISQMRKLGLRERSGLEPTFPDSKLVLLTFPPHHTLLPSKLGPVLGTRI